MSTTFWVLRSQIEKHLRKGILTVIPDPPTDWWWIKLTLSSTTSTATSRHCYSATWGDGSKLLFAWNTKYMGLKESSTSFEYIHSVECEHGYQITFPHKAWCLHMGSNTKRKSLIIGNVYEHGDLPMSTMHFQVTWNKRIFLQISFPRGNCARSLKIQDTRYFIVLLCIQLYTYKTKYTRT